MRLIAVASVIAGAGCSLPPREASYDSIDPVERTMAITETARDRDLQDVPDLIGELDSSDAAVRMMAIATLRDLTGQDLGYDPTARPGERQAAIERWVRWWRANQNPNGSGSTEGVGAGNGRYNPEPSQGPSSAAAGPSVSIDLAAS